MFANRLWATDCDGVRLRDPTWIFSTQERFLCWPLSCSLSLPTILASTLFFSKHWLEGKISLDVGEHCWFTATTQQWVNYNISHPGEILKSCLASLLPVSSQAAWLCILIEGAMPCHMLQDGFQSQSVGPWGLQRHPTYTWLWFSHLAFITKFSFEDRFLLCSKIAAAG